MVNKGVTSLASLRKKNETNTTVSEIEKEKDRNKG